MMGETEAMTEWTRIHRFPPSQEFSRAPELVRCAHGIELVYDMETAGGDYVSCRVSFRGVLAYRYTSWLAFQAWMAQAYDSLCDLGDTPWLSEVKSFYRGDHSEQYRHYGVFFDEHGFYEIVAKEVITVPADT